MTGRSRFGLIPRPGNEIGVGGGMMTAARRSAVMRLSFFAVGGLAAGAIMK